MGVLQQHIIFWDRNGDGVITPIDTYIGFRELGFNIFFSLIAVVVINLNFSLPTRLAHSWIPDPLFRVYVDSIHKSMHGHRCAVDPFGWGAAIFEWGTTWLLIQKDGRVYREDIRQLYDGSLFWRI